jgi:hypothetical protein
MHHREPNQSFGAKWFLMIGYDAYPPPGSGLAAAKGFYLYSLRKPV